MQETITTYLLANPQKAIPMKRNEFYKEQIEVYREAGKPTRATAVVQVLLFTPDADVILQKRSPEKLHNAGLIDKTVGGHIQFGDTETYTVMTETLQELKVPSFVLNSEEDFNKTFQLLYNYLDSAALVQFIDSKIETLEKSFDNQKILIANKYYFYLGVYNGPIKPADKEASGILFYKYSALKKELDSLPDLFTSDLKTFLRKYDKKINAFTKKLKKYR